MVYGDKKLSEADYEAIDKFVNRPLKRCLRDIEIITQIKKGERYNAENGRTIKQDEGLIKNFGEYELLYSRINNFEAEKERTKEVAGLIYLCGGVATAFIIGVLNEAIPDYNVAKEMVKGGAPIAMCVLSMSYLKDYFRIVTLEREMIREFAQKYYMDCPEQFKQLINQENVTLIGKIKSCFKQQGKQKEITKGR